MCLQRRSYQVKILVGGRNKVRTQYKEREDQCQMLQDEVKSLRNEANEKDKTIKKLIERSNYYKGLEAEMASLKEDLENSNKKNEELIQAFEEQENEFLELGNKWKKEENLKKS